MCFGNIRQALLDARLPLFICWLLNGPILLIRMWIESDDVQTPARVLLFVKRIYSRHPLTLVSNAVRRMLKLIARE